MPSKSSLLFLGGLLSSRAQFKFKCIQQINEYGQRQGIQDDENADRSARGATYNMKRPPERYAWWKAHFWVDNGFVRKFHRYHIGNSTTGAPSLPLPLVLSLVQ